MELSRRKFVALTVVACVGCQTQHDGGEALQTRTIDAGPAARYDADGIYSDFRHHGFFLVRREGQLIALSSDCTHRDCPLRAAPDQSFTCRCHGSKFDETGHVLHGPAVRDLPHFATTIDENQHLLVLVSRVKFDEE